MQFLIDNSAIILFVVAVIFIALGIVKRRIVPILIAIAVLISMAIVQPQVIENVKTTVTNFFMGGIDPLKDEDYKDVTDDLQGFEEKVEPEKQPDIFTRQ